MKRKRRNLYRRIALMLCFVFCLEVLSPASDAFAEEPVRQTTTETETHNQAQQELGSYETTGIRLTDPNTKESVVVPIVKTTQTVGNKVLTTNSVDVEWLKEYCENPDNNMSMSSFESADGGYKFDGEIQYSVTIDNQGTTVPIIGEEAMLNAPKDYWGGCWSQRTVDNITGNNASGNSICDGVYYCSPTPKPTNTPIPTPVEKTDLSEPDPTNLPTQIPTNAPTAVPEKDEEPTPIPTPEATATPKPSASPTPAPTPAPKTITISRRYKYTDYFSTTNGHSISDIAVNGIISGKNGSSIGSLANKINTVGVRTAYSVGTDDSGNTWYFIPTTTEFKETVANPSGYGSTTIRGYNCVSVHPKTYKGFDVESAEVRYINELTFPKFIKSGGVTYRVTSIGGSGPYYYGNASSAGYYVESDLGQFKGSYSYKNGGSGQNSESFTYLMGVIGNGSITSSGFTSQTTRPGYDYYVYENSYSRNYYVYNTTLSSITLPSTCTTIEPYAFYNCQQLIEIKFDSDAANSLVEIGDYAFYVSEPPALVRSYFYEYEDGSSSKIVTAYDGSYVYGYATPFSRSMYKFQAVVMIAPKMIFPALKYLEVIGESAFENRYHLKEVVLYNKIAQIKKNAFKNCLLESIEIPTTGEKTVIEGDYETLGTKGKEVQLKTLILTYKDSAAFKYGQKYDDYYRVMPPAYIAYAPNGGTPATTKLDRASVKYIDATYTDQFYVDHYDYHANHSGSNIPAINTAIWLGEEGTLYYAKPDHQKISGGAIPATKNIKFKSLEPFDFFDNTYLATKENDKKIIITISYNNSTTPIFAVKNWNPPVAVEECLSIEECDASGVYPVYRFTGPDGRYHWYRTDGVWVSEPELPGEISRVMSETLTEYGNVYSDCTVKTSHHKMILLSDGTVYIKSAPDSEWLLVPGSYDYIGNGPYSKPWFAYNLQEDGTYKGFQIYIANDYSKPTESGYELYVSVKEAASYDFYKSSDRSMYFLDYNDDRVYISLATEFQSENSHTQTLASETIAASTQFSGGDSWTSSSTLHLSKNNITKEYKVETSIPSAYTGSPKDTYIVGYNELLGVRFGSGNMNYSNNGGSAGYKNSNYFSYYLDEDGYIQRTSNVSAIPAGIVSSKRFVKVVALTSLLAPFENWYATSHGTCLSSGCQGENYSRSTTNKGIKVPYTLSSGTTSYRYTGYPTICVAALDEEGHLWYGQFYYNSDSGKIVESLTQYDDKVYTDIVKYDEERPVVYSGDDSDYNEDGSYSYSSSGSGGIITYFYALDTNKDVRGFSYYSLSISGSQNSAGTGTSHYSGGSENSVHQTPEFVLTEANYSDDVERFADFPLCILSTKEPASLPYPKAALDIYLGIELTYYFSQNKWFTKDGQEFYNWNTSRDGTGTSYEVGETKTVSIDNFTGSIETLTVYAQWGDPVPGPSYVYYDANGGYGDMDATVIPVGETRFTVSQNRYTREGYSFAGYFTENADGTGKKYIPGQAATISKKHTIVYAQWVPHTYTVKFAYDDIRVVPTYIFEEAVLKFDDSIGMPLEPYKKYCIVDYDLNTNDKMSTAASAKWTTPWPFTEEYTTITPKFQGWRKYYFRNNTLIRDIHATLYKEMEEVWGLSNVKDDTVILYPEWGGLEGHVILPGASCNGYELYGYMDTPVYEDAAYVAEYCYENGGGLYAPPADTERETLYAWWQPLRYKVKLVSTFEGNPPDTTGDTSVTMTFDAECPDVVAPTLEHYVFAGYYTEPDGKGEKYYGRADSITGKAGAYEGKLWQIYDGSVDTLYAYWLPDKAIQYEANYMPVSPDNDADEYTTWTEYIVTEETHWTLAENRFTRTGYHFTGWNTKADGSGTSYRDKETIDISWINGTVPLYAMWAPNEYTVQFAPDSIEEDPVIPPPGPDDIWTYEEEYTIPGQPYVKHDKVTYDLNRDDKSTEPYMVTDLTDGHTKSIYRFIGWQLYEKTASGYVKLDSLFTEGQVVKNLTAEEGKAYVLFPVWEEVPDGVTLPLAACMGYLFHGWTEICTKDSMADSSDILTAGETYITDGDTTLYAYWTPKEYDVILDDRGATSTGHTESVHMVFDEVGPDIIVPEKTGYTFQGYFTGIRGAGTKYYDETGTCVKPWTEDNVYVLFACWAQEEVKLPEIGDRTPPEELPEGDMGGNVGRTDAKGLLYADDYNSATDALTDLQPYLAYDTPGSEGAVPGTEKLAFRAKMGSWMLSYKFHRSSGTDYVRIYVAVPYRTQYEESETEKLVISPVQTKTYEVVVPKAWSYWEVLESGMYYPDKVDVTNAALKDGSITVEVDREGNSAVAVPSYSVTKYGDKEEHVFWDDYDADGTPVLYIILEEIQYIISNVPDTLPNIDRHLKIVCENAAWEDNRQASVRSDKYEFGGEIILSDELNTDGNGAGLQEEKLPDEESAVEFTSYLQTYESGIELDEYKPNGAYGTTAVITYVGDEANIGTAATKEVVLSDINAVRIHTPVACEGVAVDGIEDGVITLKNALNFFTLRIDNTGTHRMSLGYGTKDFSFALSGKSNVAVKNGSHLNQVKFPFDVYVDVGNNSLKEDGTYDTTGDYYFAAGTWFTMGMEEQRFYIPVTQKNGSFVVEFRTIAVNCPKSADGNYQLAGMIQEHVNTDKTKYAVTDFMELAVRSYLKDFIITDTNDPTALRELKAGNQALTLKKGYEFSYQVLTQGEFYGENSEIEIVPSYFWVSEDGAKRQEVTLYRMRELPEKTWKECYAWENEPLLKQHENWDVILQRWGGNGGVPSDVLCVVSDTKQGYCAVCKKRCYVTGNAGVCEICQTPLQNMQPFSLEEYVSKQTITGKENFFKRSGYLVIQFEIRVKSEENVWYMFERWHDTKLAKDALAAGWKYVSGDVIRYDLSKSIADDYEVGGME